jgi:hypothetical protein
MTRRPSLLIAVAGGLALAVAIAIVGVLLLRPSSTASVGSITVACEGVGSGEACGAWASDLLAQGPGVHTFDPEDLAHLRLTRPFLLPGDCEVAYYVSRTLEQPAAREAVACPEA